MPLKYVLVDERYPDFTIRDDAWSGMTPVEFSDEEVARIEAATLEYEDVQNLMRMRLDRSGGA